MDDIPENEWKKDKWREELAAAVTEEDFQRVKYRIDDNGGYHHKIITSAVVLRCYLEFLGPLPRKKLLQYFYHIADKNRTDLMSVFIPHYLTLEDLQKARDCCYYYYVLVTRCIEKRLVDVMSFLFAQGFEYLDRFWIINRSTNYFFLACQVGGVDIVNLFLSHEVDVNYLGIFQDNAAYYALLSGDIRILDRLILAGCNLQGNIRHETVACGCTIRITLWNVAAYNCCKISNFEEVCQRLHDMRVPAGSGDLIGRLIECQKKHISISPREERQPWFEAKITGRIISLMLDVGIRKPTYPRIEEEMLYFLRVYEESEDAEKNSGKEGES